MVKGRKPLHFSSTERSFDKQTIPHEIEPTTMIPTDLKFYLLTNKVKFKLGNVAPDINELHATDKETEDEMKQESTKEIKTLKIDVRFQKNLHL